MAPIKQKPIAGFSKKHPFNNPQNHERLLQHVVSRMDQAKQTRDALLSKFSDIDKQVHGYIKYSESDKERMRENREGKGPKPVSVNLPLIAAKLDEYATFLLEVFWPNQGMHSAIAKKDEQPLANGVALLMNQHAAYKQHYRKLSRFLFDSLKYNLAACVVEWCEERGYQLKNAPDKSIRVDKDQVIWRGNDLVNLEMYNFFWDPAVHPVEVATKGEFFGYVELLTPFALRKLAAGGSIFGVDRVLCKAERAGPHARYSTETARGGSVKYYEAPPVVRDTTTSQGGEVNWFRFAGAHGGNYEGVEFLTFNCWLNPKEFGLSEDEELQIWRIRVANNMYIVETEHLNNAHNMLPVCVTSPSEDGLWLQQKSCGETLSDFQQFASFLMNVHQSASRKSLHGLTVFDPTFVNLTDQGDDIAGRAPVLPSGYGKPIGDHVRVFNDAPRTEGTMQDVARIMDMMEAVQPTNILKQVTDLERATNYQAAATVQGANRRSLKAARVIDDQAIKPMKRMMYNNVLQYQDTVEVLDPQGVLISVDVAKLRELKLEYSIGEGLQGMDKLMTMSVLKDVLMAVIQSQQAIQEIDVVALLDYWTSMLGDKTDLSQFRRRAPSLEQQNELANDANARQVAQTEAAMAAAQQAQATNQGVGY